MRTYATAAVLMTAAVLLAVCTSALPAPSASPASIATAPSRKPAHLERLPQEQAVLDAFTGGGLVVATIGGTKSEGQLGRVLPARVFIVEPLGGMGEGADVLFLPTEDRWDIRVCETPSPTAPRMLYEIEVNGARVGGSDASRRIHHLVSDRFFVIAYADRSADALQRGLGLSPASC